MCMVKLDHGNFACRKSLDGSGRALKNAAMHVCLHCNEGRSSEVECGKLERASTPLFSEHVRCTAHAWALFNDNHIPPPHARYGHAKPTQICFCDRGIPHQPLNFIDHPLHIINHDLQL